MGWIGDVYAIGPVFADNAFKGRGAGKAVMVALIEKVRSENAKSIRLCQVISRHCFENCPRRIDYVLIVLFY